MSGALALPLALVGFVWKWLLASQALPLMYSSLSALAIVKRSVMMLALRSVWISLWAIATIFLIHAIRVVALDPKLEKEVLTLETLSYTRAHARQAML